MNFRKYTKSKLLLVFLTLANFSVTPVHSQQLFSYKSSSGTITFTSRKPVSRSYKIVSPKTPKYSVVVHRGLGYHWNPFPKATKYDDLIKEMAKKHQVEAAVIKAVMHIESAFNSQAKSSAGARGLMQLMPATAKRFGVYDSYHPIENLSGGIKYLRWLYERFDGNLRFVLAGYNAGEGAVDQYKGIPPYRETQDYVKKVLKMAEMYRCDFKGEDPTCKNKKSTKVVPTQNVKIDTTSVTSVNLSSKG